MNKHQPTQSALDLYIDKIVDRLKKKYDNAGKNRLKDKVTFIYNKYTFGQWMMRGAKKSECFKKSRLEIPYTELERCLRENKLPTEIEKLL
jgi:hypothetical protein